MKIVFIFWIAFILIYFLVPVIIKFCYKFKFLDKPAKRKVHTRPIPRLGGLAIVASFFLTLWFALRIDSAFREAFVPKLPGFVIATLLLVLLGLWDDLYGAKARFKLIVQIAIGVILYYSGAKVGVFTNAVTGGEIKLLLPLSLALTVLWVIVMINAINLIDGLDGLASGIVFIAGFFLLLVGLYLKTQIPVMLLCILCGTTFGFLLFNFPPAKIFLGDTGSMFLGLVLVFSSLIDLQYKASTAAALLIPLCVLVLPLSDTLLAIWRRWAKKGSIFIADKKHLHHRFLQLGLNQRQVVLAFYLVTAYFGVISFLFVLIPNAYALVLFGVLAVGLYFAIRTLGFIERKIRKHP